MKVLVTGASGFLGGRLCHALLRQGHNIRALVRRTSDLSSLPPATDGDASFEIVYGDVTDYQSLLAAFSDCQVVFHTAAVVEPWLPDPSKFFSVNVGGLKNVLQAVRETKTVEKLIYTSSFFALGPTDGHVADENQLVERFNGRLPGYIGSGNDKFSFSHVDDVVEGHIGAMNKGRPGERYLLTGENASFRHVFDLSAIITETRKPLFNIPYWVIEGYGWVSVLFSRITGQLPLISPPTVRVLRHQWEYSCEKAKLDLDYNPRGLKEGLAEMLHWLKNLGLIKF
ncbi:putative dihydroflavonol 4-reductase isoform X2 [Carya illinoinensis]|uniref:putative dihydroflavonol 4-reductase isoform X2 n=1 Tax=Carya illinoinensis TaxID=32201 RepID=UPI001C721055|nr:putative dihydroflavonol 4-reductase isoform X2 [Carya illinoinensis]